MTQIGCGVRRDLGWPVSGREVADKHEDLPICHLPPGSLKNHWRPTKTTDRRRRVRSCAVPFSIAEVMPACRSSKWSPVIKVLKQSCWLGAAFFLLPPRRSRIFSYCFAGPLKKSASKTTANSSAHSYTMQQCYYEKCSLWNLVKQGISFFT